MLRVEEASALAGTTPRAIYRWIEVGKLHFAESDKGLVLVCTQSLANFVSATRPAEEKTRMLALEEVRRQPSARSGKRE